MYCGGGHFGFPIGIKHNIKFVENLPMIIPGQFGFKNVQMPSSQKLQILLKPNCT
jgi:hypothetical protein